MQNYDQTEQVPTIVATRRYDPNSHITWLEFDRKPDETIRAALKAHGWRWGAYRGQWFNNRRWANVPAIITIEASEECDYSSDRADRLQDRADKHRELSTAYYEKSNAAVAHIPLGQPILVGHHSERGHRRDLARSWAAMDKSVEESKTSDRLNYAAKSSASHQQYKQTPEAMQRRHDRLSAEYRSLQRREWRATNPEEWQRRADWYEQEIASLAEAIATAGGIKADSLNIEVGDMVRACGFPAIVRRVNKKTYTVVFSGRDNWKMTMDRTKVTALLKKHDAPEEEKAESAEA